MEKPLVAFDPLPNSLPLQGKRALAAHPPSCHPQRVFGRRENEKENEIKRKTRASWRSFLKPIFTIKWKSPFQSLRWVDLYPALLQITKQKKTTNPTLLQGEFGKKYKKEKKKVKRAARILSKMNNGKSYE